MPDKNQSKAALIQMMSEPDSKTLKDAVWAILRTAPDLVNEPLTDAGETIVHLAAAKGYHKHLLDFLVHGYEIRTNLNAKDNKGRSPLLVAAAHGQTDAFILLAMSQNHQQEAAFIVDAARRGQLQTVVMPQLPAQGFHLDKEGNTASHLAVANDKAEMAALLSKAAYLTSQNQAGQTPLHVALEQKKQVAAQLINTIKHLASDEHTVIVNIADKKGNTLILLAAKNGQLAYMQELLACGAAWNAVSKDGMSILHHSAGANAHQVAKVQELITNALKSPHKVTQQNARELIGLQNSDGQTALHLAFENDDLKFAEFLIKHKINLNAPDKNGKTALHYAAEKNNLALVDLLLKSGADPRITNKAGKTPAQLSQSATIVRSCTLYAENLKALDNNEKVFIDTLLKLGFDKDPNPKSMQAIFLKLRRDELPLPQKYHNAFADLKELFLGTSAQVLDVKDTLVQMMKLLIPEISDPKKVASQENLVKWLHVLVEHPPEPVKAPISTVTKEFSNLNYRHPADVRKDIAELEKARKTLSESAIDVDEFVAISKREGFDPKPILDKHKNDMREAENKIASLERKIKIDQIKLLAVEKAELRALTLKLLNDNAPLAARTLVTEASLEKNRELLKATSGFSPEEKESVKSFEEKILKNEKEKLSKDQLLAKFPALKEKLATLATPTASQAAPSDKKPSSAAATAGKIGLHRAAAPDASTAEPPSAQAGKKSTP